MNYLIFLSALVLQAQTVPFPGPTVFQPPSASFSVVHHKFCSSSATGTACTLGFTSDTANSIVIVSMQNDGTAATDISFDDGHSTTYTQFAAATHTNGAFSFTYSYGQWLGKPSAGITTMTPSWSGGAGKNAYYVLEVSGLTPTADVGVANPSDGSSSFDSLVTTGTATSTSEIAFCGIFYPVTDTTTFTNTGVGTWTSISADTDSTNVLTAHIWYQTPLNTTTPRCSGTMSASVSARITVGVYK